MYVLLILFALFCLQLIYLKKWKYKSLKNIPGPSGNGFFGSKSVSTGKIDDMFQNIISLNEQFGKFVLVWTSPVTPKIIIADPQTSQKIINSHFSKSSLYNHMIPFMGRGLVTAEVEQWKKDRKLTNVSFNLKLMDVYNDSFEYYGNELVSILNEKIGMKSVDLVPLVDLYALDVICDTMIGVRTHLLKSGDMEYLHARSKFLTIVMNRTYSFYKGYDFLFKLTEEYKTRTRCEETLKKFSKYLISEYMKHNRKQNVDDVNFKNLFETLIDGGVSGDRLIDQVSTFVVAGQDTPATTVAYTLYEIAHNPEIQKRVLEESLTILGTDKNVVITRSDINQMTYLEAVIKEALRHYPPVPMIERKLDENLEIDGGVVPAGTDVTINIYGMQHDPQYFEYPHTFDPDRFLPENSSKLNLAAFLPFSKGPRDCIGKTFAMYQMKSIISKVVRNFELLPADPPVAIELTSEFVMKSKCGLQVQIKPRLLL